MAGTPPPMDLNWNDHIGPLFSSACNNCHGAVQPQSGLDLTTYVGAVSGGNQGPLLENTDPDSSMLIDYLRGRNNRLAMPPGNPLSEREINHVENWLRDGAPEEAGQ